MTRKIIDDLGSTLIASGNGQRFEIRPHGEYSIL